VGHFNWPLTPGTGFERFQVEYPGETIKDSFVFTEQEYHAMTKLLVSYTLKVPPGASAMDSLVDLPDSVTAEEIPDFVKKTIRPPADPDPTDGLRRRGPSQCDR